MANENNFILAIALGSSKISAIVGHKEPDGAIKVLAYAQEPSGSFIRKGRVNNVNKMTACINNMKEKLEKKVQKRIGYAYVGIGGMGVHSETSAVVRQFSEKTTITQEIVDEMSQANKSSSSAEREILESVAMEFKLGTQLTSDPVGIQSESIEGHYLNIVGNPSLREDIRNCFKDAEIGIKGMPITIQALSDIVLSDSEKSSGCAMVDLGAETTTVAVYKNKLLRHVAVLPLGSANVNRDITSLQIEDEEAEQLKLQYGEAIYDPTESKHETLTLNDGRSIPFNEFSSLVEARMEEIIMNVDNQIKLSKYDKNSLIGGIYLVGGAAEMKHLEKAIRTYTDFATLKTKKELNIPLRGSNVAELKKDFGYCCALAVLDQASENCCAGDLGSNTVSIFDEEEKLRKQEEAERKAQEEMERQAKEKEAQEASPEQGQQETGEAEQQEQQNGLGWKKKFSERFSQKLQWLTKMVNEDE